MVFGLNRRLSVKHDSRSHILDSSAALGPPEPLHGWPQPTPPAPGRLHQVTRHLDVAVAVRARARTRQVPTSPRSLLFSRVG